MKKLITHLLKLKMFICKLLTCFLPKKYRKNVRNFLFWFSFRDYFKFKNQNFHIVSLGSTCLPRVLATAIKLKPRKIYGERTLPFDLFISELEEVTEFIQNDFSTFFDNVNLTEFKFPHDYKRSFELFKKRYTKRIQNFQEIMQSDKMIYFIYFNTQNPDIQKLYEVLKEKRGDKPFKLIYLNSEKTDNENVIQITRDFEVNHKNWAESFINQYKNKNNKYTEYCKSVGEELKEIINC